jgi:hypothetical protein
MFLHCSSASEQRACRVPLLEVALRGDGMGENGMLLAYIIEQTGWRVVASIDPFEPPCT